jgi:hypothetical protein
MPMGQEIGSRRGCRPHPECACPAGGHYRYSVVAEQTTANQRRRSRPSRTAAVAHHSVNPRGRASRATRTLRF